MVLIQKQYSINRASKYYDWKTILLAPYSDMWKERFLNVAPNLVEWADIIQREIEQRTFYFVITMLEIYNFMLDPKIWKGFSHSVVLMLYYINIKNVMFLYVEDEQQFYKYNGKCWEVLDTEETYNDLVSFLTSLQINSATFNFKDSGNSLQEIIEHIKVPTWSYVSRYNCLHGFFICKMARIRFVPIIHLFGNAKLLILKCQKNSFLI